MPSLIAWLDASADEQRRMRELVALFSMADSRDELGLGQIRDATSDALFPGTSTLHTRARYALLVPWCFEHAARSKHPARRLDELERGLIGVLKQSTDSDGLLGATAGRALKNLPSTVYWSMLERWGILARGASRAEALALSKAHAVAGGEDGEPGAWSSIWTTPPAAAGFPHDLHDGLSLASHEAAWLQDRILESAPGTLLAHFATRRPSRESPAPWDDPRAAEAPQRAKGLLHQAQLFSSVVHGAQLLYNLLVAQECQATGVGLQDLRGEPVVDLYRRELADWAAALHLVHGVEDWSVESLLRTLGTERAAPLPVAAGARAFVREWTHIVQGTDPSTIADSAAAREAVTRRERMKGGKARLGNPQRLAAWSGESGRGALRFRWPVVRTILTDIHDGLARV